jgi:hypothetical protein
MAAIKASNLIFRFTIDAVLKVVERWGTVLAVSILKYLARAVGVAWRHCVWGVA